MSIVNIFNTSTGETIKSITLNVKEEEVVNTAISLLDYQIKNLRRNLLLGTFGISYENI